MTIIKKEVKLTYACPRHLNGQNQCFDLIDPMVCAWHPLDVWTKMAAAEDKK